MTTPISLKKTGVLKSHDVHKYTMLLNWNEKYNIFIQLNVI